ncbi:MAG TPA: acyl-CoA thioesterase [Dehalococcoidales bacterium]|jgi:uncharacterized protein (TIGR00369 family)
MEGKTVSESAVILSQLMGPQETNNAGNVHGGVIMRLIDSTAGVVAIRHARSNAVTASIDRLDFLYPAFAGDLVTFKASLNYVGATSMEIGVRVETENLITGEKRHTGSAYLTYVALDESGRPRRIPGLILATDEEIRRNCEAKERREMRLKERKRENSKSCK